MHDAQANAALGPILVVDDDPAIVRVLCRLIGKVCPAVGATTIVEANGHIESGGRLTGLILDVHLQEGSGWEVLVTARARDPLLPAMMLTGMRWSSLVEQAREFHAIPYEKPLEPGDAVRFAESAKQLQENAKTRMAGLVQELKDRCRLTADETGAVEATITGEPRSMNPHLLQKLGAKSVRDLRDTLLRSYFGS